MVNAYLKGKQDYYDGKYRADNPFEDGSDNHKWWDDGWLSSKKENLE